MGEVMDQRTVILCRGCHISSGGFILSLRVFELLTFQIQQMPVLKLIDATRASDGLIVALKRVKREEGAEEIAITRYLSQETFQADERNHCARFVDVLDPEDGDEVFLVIPLLRRFYDPDLESLDDAVDFVRQLLEVRSLKSLSSRISSLITTSGTGIYA